MMRFAAALSIDAWRNICSVRIHFVHILCPVSVIGFAIQSAPSSIFADIFTPCDRICFVHE